MSDAITKETTLTVGLDLGDRYIQVCVLDETGEVVEESRLPNRRAALERRFGVCEPLRIVLEAGTHSPWVSRLLTDLGHEVLVANPRKLRLIYKNESKSDRVDAEYLARLGRLDPSLLAPLRHRSAETQKDLAVLRSRMCLVRARSSGSPKPEMIICAGSLLPPPTTSSVPSDRTLISGAGDSRSVRKAPRAARSGRWWLWPANSRCFCFDCGRQGRSTSP